MGAAVRSRIPSFYQEMSEVCVVIFMFMSDQQIRDVLIRKTELCQFQTGSVAAVYQEILILVLHECGRIPAFRIYARCSGSDGNDPESFRHR